eukprot:g6505.t1
MTIISLSTRSLVFKSPRRCLVKRTRPLTRTAAGFDPDLLEQAVRSITTNELHLEDISHSVSNLLATISDADLAAEVVQKTTEAATSDVATTVASKSGPFTAIADALEYCLNVIDSGLETLHVPYAYGFSIIILTVLVKIVTFPLSKKQVESSIAMQALQPQLKEIQEKYKNNPEEIQQKTAALYQTAGVNPLAGCLPTLATIPVFIGLYRGLLNAADEGVLSDGFFLIPSLAGPTTISARQAGMGLSWLFPFKDGAPPIGWHDASAYLILPFFLVVSQYISQQVLQPTRSTDPSQSGAQTFLKFLPLLLGWFSLNVPSGLTLYWITNNILTTGQQVYLKRGVTTPTAAAPSTTMSSSGPVIETTATDVRSTTTTTSEVKPSGQEMGARRSSKKGEKFRARKAREAAKKARKVSSRRKKKAFVQEAPIEDVANEFEKELATSALSVEKPTETYEVEQKESNNVSG